MQYDKLKNIFLFVCFALLCSFTTKADDKEYAASKIPVFLLKDANAVVRKHILQFTVKSESKAIEKEIIAVTVFNKEGRDYGFKHVIYDAFSKIKTFEGKVFDAQGEEINSLSSSDIIDVKGISEMSLCDDYRFKAAALENPIYPYTVEFTIETSYNGYLNWPSWSAYITDDPVVYNRFEVVVYDKKQFRYWSNKPDIQPQVTNNGDQTSYVWEAKNMPKLPAESSGDVNDGAGYYVFTAPLNFSLDDRPGTLDSWKNFGIWLTKLWEGRDQLPVEAVADVKRITEGISDPKEKVRKIYAYMQSRTRYISVQLGIGGFQPISADFVHEKGYGDCKGLSNYFIALLKAAGIKAYPLIIYLGKTRYPCITEFPSNRFNHAMAVVPVLGDTLFFECTSQTIPPGMMSSSTQNRGALVLDGEQSRIIRTPSSTPDENLQVRVGTAIINSRGNADMSMTVSWYGTQRHQVCSLVDNESPEEKHKWVMNEINLPGAYIRSLEFSGVKEKAPSIVMHLSLLAQNYATMNGERLFVNPNIAGRSTYIPPVLEKRYSPILISSQTKDIDTIHIKIPEGYSIEALPSKTDISTAFAEYHSQITVINPTELLYVRASMYKQDMVPAEKYSEYKKFFTDIAKADRAQIVFLAKKQ
ncbi:MAG: DUF3857 and transglutaminase domain-containing protein [Ignavibacteria bacterium]|nr:DUF3857 and transglutaminase domain-containing protein [Ignavibacteria bacterium]